MWVPSTWTCDNDVLADLYAFSEGPRPSGPPAPLPETVRQYNKQMELNKQKPFNSDIDESLSYIVSGRGRGTSDRICRPGQAIETHPSDEVELKKQIRQVAGLGYSNELIERTIKANEFDPKDCTDIDPSFQFVVASSGSGNSNKSSKESSPKKKPGVSSKDACFEDAD